MTGTDSILLSSDASDVASDDPKDAEVDERDPKLSLVSVVSWLPSLSGEDVDSVPLFSLLVVSVVRDLVSGAFFL